MQLKAYQQRALDVLSSFLTDCRTDGVLSAWQATMQTQQRHNVYQAQAFGEQVPCVCLRLPTGGGKTLLASYALALTGKQWQDTSTPVAVWFTPTDTIRVQTLEALSNPKHPYRMALNEQFGNKVAVCDLESLTLPVLQSVGQQAIVLVSTMQAFHIQDTSKRSVYAFDEMLEPYFARLASNMEGLERVSNEDIQSHSYLGAADIGRVKASLVNWLYCQRPILIIDEAHNGKSSSKTAERNFITLNRLNPSAVIELTATPAASSNVLYHVSALELKNESMIKLPIVLHEHRTGWQDAVEDALRTQKRLELEAQKEPDYIRPMVLFQAEAMNGTVTVDVLRDYLEQALHIPTHQIAVVTGKQKELDGINLFDPLCAIRYVITVEALKEGWDCPFAYVLCSLQNARSAKDVEQLLGRVLRMPYAKQRQQAPLNQAYAHIVSQAFAGVAQALMDNLVANMGFDPLDAALAILPAQNTLGLEGGAGLPLFDQVQGHVNTVISLPVAIPQTIPSSLSGVLTFHETGSGCSAFITGELTSEVADYLLSVVPKKAQPLVAQHIAQQQAIQQTQQAPSVKGELFAPIPQLCLFDGDTFFPVDMTSLSDLGSFDLLGELVSLEGFSLVENADVFEIDLVGKKISYTKVDETHQLPLNAVRSFITETDLVHWLDGQVYQPDISQPVMRKYLTLLVQHCQRDRGFSLTALVRAKFVLAQAIRSRITQQRTNATAIGFKQALPNMQVAQSVEGFAYSIRFPVSGYGRPPFYAGRYVFKKHYYGNAQIHDLSEKRPDGSVREEFACAQAIDTHPNIKHWIRNIPKDSQSFRLPVATGWFYPDFVCELIDGRILVVEYKGKPLVTNDESKEKNQVGLQWANSSSGQCLFIMAEKQDAQGRDVKAQITALLEQTP